MFLNSFSLLKAGVILAYFKTDEKSDFLIDALKLDCKKSANVSGFSLRILVGTNIE